jgi:hypothetical protein
VSYGRQSVQRQRTPAVAGGIQRTWVQVTRIPHRANQAPIQMKKYVLLHGLLLLFLCFSRGPFPFSHSLHLAPDTRGTKGPAAVARDQRYLNAVQAQIRQDQIWRPTEKIKCYTVESHSLRAGRPKYVSINPRRPKTYIFNPHFRFFLRFGDFLPVLGLLGPLSASIFFYLIRVWAKILVCRSAPAKNNN